MAAEPQLLQLIMLARQNPASLGPLLHELSQTRPDLIHLVQSEQDAFQRLLTAESLPEAAAPAPSMPREPSTPREVRIELTRDEVEAVKRLMSLGFSQDEALSAFMACEKNEQLAANVLFDSN